MWVAVTFAAIALTGTGFMAWFLLALLLDGAPSTCCWIVPIRREQYRESSRVRGGRYFDNDRATGCNPRDYYVELLENEDHAEEDREEEGASNPIAIDIGVLSDGGGWRSIQPSGAFHEGRIQFN